jgi:hypothetical protein
MDEIGRRDEYGTTEYDADKSKGERSSPRN